MEINRQKFGAVMLIQPKGPLTGSDATQLRLEVDEARITCMGRLVLDMEQVSYVDSIGLEALLDISDRMAESGKSLKMCGLNDTVRQVLELTELAVLFEYYEDANTATRSYM